MLREKAIEILENEFEEYSVTDFYETFSEFAKRAAQPFDTRGQGIQYNCTTLFFMGSYISGDDEVNCFLHIHDGLPMDDIRIRQDAPEKEVYEDVITKTAQYSQEWVSRQDNIDLLNIVEERFNKFAKEHKVSYLQQDLILGLMKTTRKAIYDMEKYYVLTPKDHDLPF